MLHFDTNIRNSVENHLNIEAKWILWDSGSGPWLGLCCFLSNKRGEISTLASKYSDSAGPHVNASRSPDIWVLLINHGLDVLYFVWVCGDYRDQQNVIKHSVHSEMLC